MQTVRLVALLTISSRGTALRLTSPPIGRSRVPTCVATPGSALAYLESVPMGPPDAILGIAQNFRECPAAEKVNLVIGAYRDENGEPYVLPSVREAEARLLKRGEKKEYAPITGNPQYVQRALAFAFGSDCEALSSGRTVGVQTLSGTGACRIAGEFYARFLPKGTTIYVSGEPTSTALSLLLWIPN